MNDFIKSMITTLSENNNLGILIAVLGIYALWRFTPSGKEKEA